MSNTKSKSKRKGRLPENLRRNVDSLLFTVYRSLITDHFPNARVVEWQTRTFEGRMPKGMRVQVPPRAPSCLGNLSVRGLIV
jgi:hypothetical protein